MKNNNILTALDNIKNQINTENTETSYNLIDALNNIAEAIKAGGSGSGSGSGSSGVFKIPVKSVDMGDDFWWELDGITFEEVATKITYSDQLVYLQLSKSNDPIEYYPFYFYPSGIKFDGQGNPYLIFSRFEISSFDSNISFNCRLQPNGHFSQGTQ